jgi:hypothetical protein
MYRSHRNLSVITCMTLVIGIAGCDDDPLATRIAIESAERQAQQNQAMTELNQQIAAGAQNLVDADAHSRKDLVSAHQELRAERKTLGNGWIDLERERQRIAAERRTESILLPVVALLSSVLLVFLLLGFCWYALVCAYGYKAGDSELADLLIRESVHDWPGLDEASRKPSRLLEECDI